MNHVMQIGRLVKDPELRFIQNGQAVCNFTLAVDRRMSKEKKAEAQANGNPTADFPRIVVWGKTAEMCANYLSKGKKVAVEGSLQTSTYKTNTGETRYSTDIVASNVEFLESASSNESQSNTPMSGGGSDENFGYNTDDFAEADSLEENPF